jgi:hypothetical protein
MKSLHIMVNKTLTIGKFIQAIDDYNVLSEGFEPVEWTLEYANPGYFFYTDDTALLDYASSWAIEETA